MALNTGKDKVAEALGTQQATATQAATQQAAPAGQGPIGLASVANMRRPSITPSGGSAMAKELHSRFDAIIQASGSEKLGVVLFDSEVNSVKLSSVIVCQKHIENPSVVSYHTIVIDSGVELQAREMNIKGIRFEIPSVAGDVFARSDVYRARVKDLVLKTTGAEKVLSTGCSVLPAGVNKEDEGLFQTLLHRATEATQNKLDKVSGIKSPFTLTQAKPTDQVIGVVNNAPSLVSTTAGLPVRSDLNIAVQVTDSQSADPYCGNVSELSRVDAFIELMPKPKQQVNQFMMGQPQQQMDLISYAPRVIVTAVNTLSPAITLEQILLSVHSTTLLSYNNSWMTAFRPTLTAAGKGKNAVDLKDIGAIGWEVNLTGDPAATPQPIVTKAASFEAAPGKGDPLIQLLSATVSPDLVYSMDIPADGEISWLLNAFASAANNGISDPRTLQARQKAIEAIVSAADNLTGGMFSQNFPQGQDICVMEEAPIHMGYYVDSAGEKRDIRDLDYLAMLNLTGKHGTAAAHKFASTFAQNGQYWPQRLSERLQQLRELLPNLKVTGYANRITFNPAFLTALRASIDATGLVLTPQNLFQEVAGGLVSMNLENMALGGQQYAGGFGQPQVMGGAYANSGSGVI